jgi:peptidoglycan hydrolase-like protein with peptidoglycan-binding domain
MTSFRTHLIAASLILGFALSPMAAATADAASRSSPRVSMVQQKLNAGGANLTVDGMMGPRTHAAIADYQRAHGLRPTGRLNNRTMTMLRRN